MIIDVACGAFREGRLFFCLARWWAKGMKGRKGRKGPIITNNFSAEGSRYNARQTKSEWAVLVRTAHSHLFC